MTILYIITAFVIGCYVGGQLVAWHIKSEFKKIDRDTVTPIAGEDLEANDLIYVDDANRVWKYRPLPLAFKKIDEECETEGTPETPVYFYRGGDGQIYPAQVLPFDGRP